MKIRRTVTFIGNVQGVGFRYTAQRLAKQFEVAGWIRNEPDGTVRCVVQGETAEVDRFIAAVEQAMAGYIREERNEVTPATGNLKGFTVK